MKTSSAAILESIAFEVYPRIREGSRALRLSMKRESLSRLLCRTFFRYDENEIFPVKPEDGFRL